MIFNSVPFILFFIVVVFIYNFFPGKYRWGLLLFASYFFYMCWKPLYIALIFCSTLIDFYVGIKIEKSSLQIVKKRWLKLSLLSNLGILFLFKYLNFFRESAYLFINFFGYGVNYTEYNILLPLGISFYTFQTLSYSINVYRGKIKAEKHFGYFALYVSYFPQLVAGPIERPERLLPQLKKNHIFSYNRMLLGIKIMLWGFFKKIVIADRLALLVNVVYSYPQKYKGVQLVIAAVFFMYQIYCDFSGYSDIARGSAIILGVDLIENFKTPFASKSITEFWSRWHISLSLWLRDYITLPLHRHLKKYKKSRAYTAIFITFLFSGLWHGANWTFVVWGVLNGTSMIVEKWIKSFNFKWLMYVKKTIFYQKIAFIQVIFTFSFVCFTGIFFRAESISDGLYIVGNLFKDIHIIFDMKLLYYALKELGMTSYDLVVSILLLILLEGYQFTLHNKTYEEAIEYLSNKPIAIRWGVYYSVIFSLLLLGVYGHQEFIYFQF